MTDNVIPIGPASAGRRIARRAIAAAEMSERLYGLERAALTLLDRAQRMRRAWEDTGDVQPESAWEALDMCAAMMAEVRDG